VLLSVFHSRREALSLFQADSALLGSSGGLVNDKVRQRGATAVVDYTLTSRSHISLAANFNESFAGVLPDPARHASLRLFVSHRLQPKLNGTIELRVLHTRSALDPRPVREHAIAASLAATF
jgi:hypothetical protein